MGSVKVLITTPELTLPGGVTGLLNLLRLDQIEGIEYFSVNFSKGKWSALLLPIVYLKFVLKVGKFDTVHLNPSMNAKSFYRDMVFAFIAKAIFGKRLIVYWHGWQEDFFQRIKCTKIGRIALSKTFCRAEVQLVLAGKFADDFRTIGYKGQLLAESNVSEKVPRSELKERPASDNWQLLYISRIIENKGWDLALNTMKILQQSGENHIKLVVAGDGSCLQSAKELARDLGLNNVVFEGYVEGEKKKRLFLDSDIFFFPTFPPEGMPIVILEGMMYGLPIITRNVGGIADHVTDIENGYVTDSVDPGDFATFILNLTSDKTLYNTIRQHNIDLSHEQFVPERLVQRLLALYQ